jgi:hypothetical protein
MQRRKNKRSEEKGVTKKKKEDLVHSNGLSIKLDHVHDLHGIVSIFLCHELTKSISLMVRCDTIFR